MSYFFPASLLRLLLSFALFIQVYASAFENLESTGMGWREGIRSGAVNANKSGHLPLDVDGYPIAPSELELQQVHVYVRHGERSPVGVRMAGPPGNLPEHWMFCHTARQFRAAVASAMPDSWAGEAVFSGEQGGSRTGIGELQSHRIVERADGTATVGECLLGELTDVGRESTYKFGTALRKLYVDRLKFLPNTIQSNDEIYLRSTDMPRTIESLQQMVHGLYPLAKCINGFVPQLRIRNPSDENLYGNTRACKRLEILQIGFAQAAAAAWNAALEPLDTKISKYIGGNPVRLDGSPRASGILDTIRAAEAHSVNIPKEFQDPSVMNIIEKAVVSEWFADHTDEVRRLGMGPLLSDLSRKMQAKAENGNTDPMKILIHSTHDTCLAGLSSTLEFFDERWPAFAAAITFELFKKRETALRPKSTWQNVFSIFDYTQDTSEHYVRVRYQNENRALSFCAQDGKHLPGSPEFCTLAAFRERVKELTPADWKGECAVKPGRRLKDREEAMAAAAKVIVVKP